MSSHEIVSDFMKVGVEHAYSKDYERRTDQFTYIAARSFYPH